MYERRVLEVEQASFYAISIHHNWRYGTQMFTIS